MNQKIISLAIGKPKSFNWNNNGEKSAIAKGTVLSAELKKTGFFGDGVANTEFHGGADRAVCLYPYEHYSLWEKTFQKKLQMHAFGENITAYGMTEAEVCIGDIYKIGTTVIQVTQGRVPCATISKFNGEEYFLSKVFESCLTGYFFRVLEEGTITMDSNIELIEKNPMEITVLFAATTLFHQKQKQAIEKILRVEALAEDWRKRYLKLLS